MEGEETVVRVKGVSYSNLGRICSTLHLKGWGTCDRNWEPHLKINDRWALVVNQGLVVVVLILFLNLGE